ncbi:MAG TPA: SigB/SigF/SigG family RNA polymerase sigma factor [Pseudonocardia sp.]|jgi:RNA polymerase sigma-B factor|nr:SigB/SigF/SigG family RNA polymerase sigma factor [Pseudonocardia sp.]
MPHPVNPAAVRSAEHVGDYRHLDPLLAEFAATARDDPRRRALRDQLTRELLPLAGHLALRFTRRGVADDDLFQVACVGLLNSLERYDSDRAVHGFLPYAITTMQGEIRRYFRDHTWSVRVSRRLKELQPALAQAVTELTAEQGRAPRPSEIATRLGVPAEEVLDALEAAQAHRCESLDQTLASTDGDGPTRGDLLGDFDEQLELVNERESLKALLGELPERERAIVVLRFFGDQTQCQIAQRVGLSQMQVSRLLTATLERLRRHPVR